MDRREPMPMSGSGSYYMQTGISKLHGLQGVPSLSNSGMPFQSNIGGSSSGPPLIMEPGSTDGLGAGAASMQRSAAPMRRKRGRPRKYGPDGKMSLALSSVLAPPRGMNTPTEKRGRGRPPGSGRKRQLAPFGKLVSGSAGVGFTPHVITVATGEDISAKLLAFAQQGPRAVCILSANGAVSTAILRQPSTSGGTVTFEGHFDILSMSGSFLLVGNDGSGDRSGCMSISLASPDGRVIGGGVGGMLIAASPVQVIVGSFVWGTSRTNAKIEKGGEGGGDSGRFSVDDSSMAAPPSSAMGGWMDMRSSHVDINLMHG